MLFYPSDRKLCVKARLTGALQVTMNVVKNNTAFFKVLQPALQVLKLYSANCKSIAMFSLLSTFSTVNEYIFFSTHWHQALQRKCHFSKVLALLGLKSGRTLFRLLSQVQCVWAYFPEQLLVIEPNKINSQVLLTQKQIEVNFHVFKLKFNFLIVRMVAKKQHLYCSSFQGHKAYYGNVEVDKI